MMKLKEFLNLIENGKKADCIYCADRVSELDELFGKDITDSSLRDSLLDMDSALDESEADWELIGDTYISEFEELVDESINEFMQLLMDEVDFSKAVENNPVNGYLLNKIAKLCRDMRRLTCLNHLNGLANAIYESKNDFLVDKEVKAYHKFIYDNGNYDIRPYYEICGVGFHGECDCTTPGIEEHATNEIKKEISSDINIDDNYNPSILEVFGIETKK